MQVYKPAGKEHYRWIVGPWKTEDMFELDALGAGRPSNTVLHLRWGHWSIDPFPIPTFLLCIFLAQITWIGTTIPVRALALARAHLSLYLCAENFTTLDLWFSNNDDYVKIYFLATFLRAGHTAWTACRITCISTDKPTRTRGRHSRIQSTVHHASQHDEEMDAAQHDTGYSGCWAGGADGMQVTLADVLLREVDVIVFLYFSSASHAITRFS